MMGGWLLATGKLGARAGDRMRRGVIAAAGGAGAHTGARMIGGTIVIGGAVGPEPGYGMKRGTLVLPTPPPRMLATFADDGAHEFPWLRLLAAELECRGALLPGPASRRRRWTGCASTGGLGELLVGGD